MTDTLAILQARTSSVRFPGKVMQPVCGEPALHRMIERVQRAFKVDRLVVGTSTDASDDPILMLCRRLDVDCFRGSLNDVLDRYYRAACEYGADHIVRLTADCVLADPVMIDDVIAEYRRGGYDYCSNVNDRTYPVGLDVEVFSFEVLETAWQEAQLSYDREHVTPFIRRNPIRFHHGMVKDLIDRSHMRWVIDEPADLEFVRRVYDRLYPYGPIFSREDVYELLEECPELSHINEGCGEAPVVYPERMAA